MIILHIACIDKNPYNGVCVVVPKYIEYEMQSSNVAFINVNNEQLFDDSIQIKYEKNFDVNNLNAPFNKPDLVVFNECYRVEYLKIFKNLIKNNIPYIIIPHGELSVEAQHKKHVKKSIANLLFFNKFIKNSIAIQCLSEREANNTHFNVKKIVASNGIDFPVARKEKYNTKGIRFNYIGRLDSYHKGLDLLIEAISMCKSELSKYKCIFNIYGPDVLGRKEIIENYISKYDVKEFITVNDPISGDDKEKVLLETDIFIQTSRFEGMPMGILEALSYGLPCLVTLGTTLGEDIEKYQAGWVADNTSLSIKNKILEALNDFDKFENYGKHSIELIEDNYVWRKTICKTLLMYKEMIKH